MAISDDPYWKSALLATLDIAPACDLIYTPKEFFPYSRKFYPLEFSYGNTSPLVGFCVQKNLLHRLAPSVLDEINFSEQVTYTNAVFIVGCAKPLEVMKWFYGGDGFRDYMQLKESVLLNSQGRNDTKYWRVDKGLPGAPSVLIVGATNMGNIGDDLIALAIGGNLRKINKNCSLYFSNFQVSRADIADFDLVIVGGGGIVYSSQFGMNDTDNLSNYFKIPFWAKALSIPCVVLGVGIQGRTDHLFHDPNVKDFLSKSLSSASYITVRDQLSVDVLSKITDKDIALVPDLVFSFISQFGSYTSNYDRGSTRSIAFIGEIFADRLSFFNRLLQETSDEILRNFYGANIYFCIMSNDDLIHKDKFVNLLKQKNIECKVHDFRSSSIVDALQFFRGLSGVVTTRFHGLVLSIIAGCPALSVDLSYGKHALLLRDYIPSMVNNLIDETMSFDDIYGKLKKLAKSPSSLLPAVDEISAIGHATEEYSNILKQFLTPE